MSEPPNEADIKPDQDTMLAHLTHHFCSDLEGQVEIRIIKPNGPVYSKLFGLDELEEAAAHAHKMNERGFNIYFGAVLRRESLESGEHGMDDDCLGARMLWLDIDDDGVADIAAHELPGLGITPSYTVVTGRHPHTRVQMFFELDEPITDSQQIAEMNQALAERLGGDPVVFNVGRIMRLAGAIAWPGKEGRVKELTEFHPQQVEPLPLATLVSKLSLQEALERAVERRNTHEGGQGITKEPAGLLGGSETVVDGREEYMRNCVMAAFIEAFGTAEAGQAVTEQMIFDLAWPVFEKSADMSRPGHNTQREMHAKCSKILRRFQEGKLKDFKTQSDVVKAWEAKQELDQLSPEIKIEQKSIDEKPTEDVNVLPVSKFLDGFTPPDYVIDGVTQRGTLVSLTAPTGVGKTAISICISLAIQQGSNIGTRATQKGTVVYFCGENPDDVRMRLLMICKTQGLDPDGLDIHVVDGTFNIAHAHDCLRTQIEAIGGAVLIVVDTLMAYFRGDDDNSNAQMAAYARDVLRPLTRLPGHPCVLVPSHPTKNARGKEMMVPRGGGAFLNEVDANLCLTSSGEKAVQLHWSGKIRGPEFEPMDFILDGLEHPEVKDSAGRILHSVMARAATQQEIEQRLSAEVSDQDRVLLAIDAMDRPSLVEIAKRLDWTNKDGQPSKSRVQRRTKDLKADQMIKLVRNRFELTKDGKEEVVKVKSERTKRREWMSR